MLDYYQTIKAPTEGLYKDRGSKFIAYTYNVENVESVDAKLVEIGLMHPKARHICYAYSIGLDDNLYRINDDGEPSGTAGRPIYNEIMSNELRDTLIAVVRYFGGTKLGVPGLINAYKSASQDALAQAEFITKYITQTIKVKYKPKDMGRLYDIIKRLGVSHIKNEYGLQPTLLIEQRQSLINDTIRQIYAQYHGYGLEDIKEDFISPDIEIELLETET